MSMANALADGVEYECTASRQVDTDEHGEVVGRS